MKKLILAFLLLAAVPCLSRAQGTAIGSGNFGNVFKWEGTNYIPGSGVTITICPSTSTGQPCTPITSQVCTDSALTLCTGNNPILTDVNGDWGPVFLGAGQYLFTITGTGITAKTYKFSISTVLTTPSGTNGDLLQFTNSSGGFGDSNIPAGNVVLLAATQTLTSKTLTSPTITAPLVTCSTASAVNSVPCIVAEANLTAQGTNITATTLYAVPAGAAGMYRVNCYVALTQAATTSSTMPACNVTWTDGDTSVVEGPAAITTTSAANTVGTVAATNAQETLNVKASTNFQYSTTGYATSGATPMQFAIHLRLEFLGP